MTVRRLHRTMRLLLSLSALAVLVLTMGPVTGAEKKEAHLSFTPPEGAQFNYRTSHQIEQNYQGMDRVISQSADVVFTLVEMMEGDIFKVSLSFSNEDASLVQDDQLMDYEPDVKLEGKEVFAFVNAKGEVSKVEASSHIPGLSSMDELREMIEDWFVRLPDTSVQVDQDWRIDIVKRGASQENQPPEVEGWIDFRLKKLEEKNGITIAEIEGKTYYDINKAMQFGKVVAEGKGDIKSKIAVEGGYIIECKRKMDIKGKMIGIDPITGKASESKLAMTQYFECKLQK
jgi:hypothetical protein